MVELPAIAAFSDRETVKVKQHIALTTGMILRVRHLACGAALARDVVEFAVGVMDA